MNSCCLVLWVPTCGDINDLYSIYTAQHYVFSIEGCLKVLVSITILKGGLGFEPLLEQLDFSS